jgi:hypothetical protein
MFHLDRNRPQNWRNRMTPEINESSGWILKHRPQTAAGNCGTASIEKHLHTAHAICAGLSDGELHHQKRGDFGRVVHGTVELSAKALGKPSYFLTTFWTVQKSDEFPKENTVIGTARRIGLPPYVFCCLVAFVLWYSFASSGHGKLMQRPLGPFVSHWKPMAPLISKRKTHCSLRVRLRRIDTVSSVRSAPIVTGLLLHCRFWISSACDLSSPHRWNRRLMWIEVQLTFYGIGNQIFTHRYCRFVNWRRCNL